MPEPVACPVSLVLSRGISVPPLALVYSSPLPVADRQRVLIAHGLLSRVMQSHGRGGFINLGQWVFPGCINPMGDFILLPCLSPCRLLVEKTMQKIQHSQVKSGVATWNRIAWVKHGIAGCHLLARVLVCLLARSLRATLE